MYMLITRKKMFQFLVKVQSLHYNGANSYLFVNGEEIIKFKARDAEDFFTDNMIKTGLYGYIYDFSVDHRVIAMFEFSKNIFL